MKPKVVAVVGPTAAGKSTVALRIGAEFHAEIVGADSVQVYRGFDIGSAKPTAEERGVLPHHLIDVVDPAHAYTAADYARDAAAAIDGIAGRGNLPLVVGGTGLYMRALFEGLMPAPGKDPEVRAALEALSTRALRERLEAVDPVRAGQIFGEDRFRLIRALEIHKATGVPPSELAERQQRNVSYDVLWIGLSPPREVLYDRIDARSDKMWHGGWLDEVRTLVKEGYADSRAMHSVGYAEVYAHLYHSVPSVSALEDAKQRTRRYAKRQLTWFRANPAVHWFDPIEPDTFDGIRFLLQEWLT